VYRDGGKELEGEERQGIHRQERGDRRDFSILFLGAISVLGGKRIWLPAAG